MSWQIFFLIFYILGIPSCMTLFIKRHAFNKRRWGGWVGAILAAVCWPLGLLLLGWAMLKQFMCEDCRTLDGVYHKHHKKVFSSRKTALESISKLEDAIAQKVLKIEFKDRVVHYHSVEQMELALDILKANNRILS